MRRKYEREERRLNPYKDRYEDPVTSTELCHQSVCRNPNEPGLSKEPNAAKDLAFSLGWKCLVDPISNTGGKIKNQIKKARVYGSNRRAIPSSTITDSYANTKGEEKGDKKLSYAKKRLAPCRKMSRFLRSIAAII